MKRPQAGVSPLTLWPSYHASAWQRVILFCSINPQILVYRGLIPCDDSVDRGVAQVCNRVAQDSCKAHLGKFVVYYLQDVLCLGLLIAHGVGINSHFVHHRHRVLNVGGPHPLDDRIVRFNDGHCWESGRNIHKFAAHEYVWELYA